MKTPIIVSMVSDAFDTATRNVQASKIITAIQRGKWRQQVEQIRRLYTKTILRSNDHEAAKEAVAPYKKKLPGVLLSGQFKERNADALFQHSGLICADLDGLDSEKLKDAREKLKKSPYLWALFRSPTWRGLKAILRVLADASKHSASFRAVEKHVRELTGIQIDQSGKDLARMCFVSYDPDAYLNPDAREIEPLTEAVEPKTATRIKSTAQGSKPDKTQIREMLAVIPKRPDYADWIKVVAAVGDALPDEDAIELLNEWSPEEHPGEYADKLRHRLTEVHIGTLIHLAREHGWRGNRQSDGNETKIHVQPGASESPPERPRVAKLKRPDQALTFDQWRAVIGENFPTLLRPAETCLSVPAQLLLNDVFNPFALALVDVPASGKTITLNFFDVPDLAYTTDNFTPASFVSHASNVKREELVNVDMLPRIRYRTLIVRDLAPIFGVKEDELLKTIGILTRALDGEGLETDSGVHGKRGYKGDWLFMLLAGTTPIPPRVFKVMGTLGSRLFFLALRSNAKSHDELIAQNRGTARREKERICREATDSFLRTLWTANPGGVNWNKNGDKEDCLRVIARCAELLAALRGTIQIWQSEHDGSVSHGVPVIEQPDRINCLLYNLARGHALLCGRTQLSTADLAPVLEVTFDSAPTIRSKVFRSLLEQNGTLKTSQVEKLLRCSKPTALKEMEALTVLGVADKTDGDPEYGRPEHELRLAGKFQWFATDECKSLCWP